MLDTWKKGWGTSTTSTESGRTFITYRRLHRWMRSIMDPQVASRAIEWLEENGDSPFFAFLGWVHPHPPWDIPESLQGLYAGRDLPDPVPISRTYPDPAEPSEWFGDFDSPELKRKTREAYYSAITLVDKNVGRILDYLRATDMLDNTLVIFTSDHGEMLYDKGYFSKELPYERSVRVPLIVRYPERFGRGEVRTEFVDHYDCLPTCLDVCGLEYPSDAYELPGESLCSAGATRDRSHMASACGIGVRRWVMCRNRRYKYVYFYNQGHEELYDMSEDPGRCTISWRAVTSRGRCAVILGGEHFAMRRSGGRRNRSGWRPRGPAGDGGSRQRPRQVPLLVQHADALLRPKIE